MSRSQKAVHFISGLFMILFGLIIILVDEFGYLAVLLILEFTLILTGVQQLLYYFTMTRYMVGGIYIFYKGIFFLNLGLFALNMDDVPRQYAMLYLVATMAISGVIAIVHSLEIKKMQSGRWFHQFFYGSTELLLSVVCLFYLDSTTTLTFVYGGSLLHAGIHRIISAFRRSAIVYISG